MRGLRMPSAIALARRLQHSALDSGLLHKTFHEVLTADPALGEAFRADLMATVKRDPASRPPDRAVALFQGLSCARRPIASRMRCGRPGRKDFALYLQSLIVALFSRSISIPRRVIGKGIMLDHATGIVIGETAVIGDNCSMLHGVTLGGTGNEKGDRHPKIGRGVMIGAGAKILGNIKVGDCARVAAGSVVLNDVPPRRTVAGVPAREIGFAGCEEPALSMDQMFVGDETHARD